MAYTIDKKTGEITINGWDNGTSSDQYNGIGKMLSCNLDTVGEVSVGYPLTSNVIGVGTIGIPIHKAMKQVNGVATLYFILDSTSQVWSSSTYNGTFSFLSTSNETTGATATNQGLVYWIPPSGGNGYLFKFRNNKIDYLTAGAGTWVKDWQTITGSVNHFAIASQDGAVYFCNGNKLGSILEIEGETFDPTNTATYTFATDALLLPPYESAQSIAEQGTNLLIGGSLNAIYPWDRLSTSFAYPIFIGDTFIDRMVTVNTNVYIFPGGAMSRGRIYVTNGSQANLFYKIPDYITGIVTQTGQSMTFSSQDPYFVWGDAIFHRNNLIFGFFMKKNGGGFTTQDNSMQTTCQVWALDLETNSFRSLSTLVGTSVNIGRANVIMPSLQTSPGMSYIVGTEDSSGASLAPIGYSGNASGIGRFNVITDIIPVGTILDKKTFAQVEFKLRAPLESGEEIAIIPIKDGVIGSQLSFPLNNAVGTISDVAQVNFQGCQWLAFWIVGNGNSATSGVRLTELKIR